MRKTGAFELKRQKEIEGTSELPMIESSPYVAMIEAGLDHLMVEAENYMREHDVKTDLLRDGWEVTYDEFMSAGQLREQVDADIAQVDALIDERNTLRTTLAREEKRLVQAQIYATIPDALSVYGNTAHTVGKLGTMPTSAWDDFIVAIEEEEGVQAQKLAFDNDKVLAFFVAHVEQKGRLESLLAEYSFAECPFERELSGEALYIKLTSSVKDLQAKIVDCDEQLFAIAQRIKDIKLYCDHLAFCQEKEQASEQMRGTNSTLFIEAYVPTESQQIVVQALEGLDIPLWYTFSQPTEEDEPPTLLHNNKVVTPFESLTNTYSPPNYREFDPNSVMAFFYSLFMGFIIGDAGYGLLMSAIGGYMAKKKKGTGMGNLCFIFAIGGIFAIVWGLMFNSLFGITLPYKAVLPDPQSDFWMLAGIKIPSVLIVALIIGVVQLGAGYVCYAVQLWRRGEILDGIFQGISWAVFSLGVDLALIGFVEEFNVPILSTVGAIMAGASLAIAALTAGRKEKFLGKFTKGFGSVYGVISYASDVLSYARLYGLMLSGAVIAGLISQYAIDFITGGNFIFAIIGILLMVVGHLFNIAISLLGAYIHDSRLQYVEFYGRFFEGEGTLFTPLGSSAKYMIVKN